MNGIALSRPALMLVAVLATGPACAQPLSGNIWSGFQSGLGGGFSGNIGSGFQSGFGAVDGGRRAQIDDFTLGSAGGFRVDTLRGQPSNFGPSIQSMSTIRDTTLTLERGPATMLEQGLSAGPAGPLD